MSNSAAPLLPKTAPFESEQIAALNRVLGASTADQRQWLAGFLAGYAAATGNAMAAPASVPVAEKRAAEPLTILYATESGNSEALALKIQALAKKRGFKPKAVDMADVMPTDIAKARNLLVIAATWGEGDPPQRAEPFYRALMDEAAPRFDETRFSVLALGDSSYVDFCLTGKKIDARLAELGAARVSERVDCDLDFEALADGWTDTALEALEPADAAASAEIIPFDVRAGTEPLVEAPTWTAKNPYGAEILEQVNLNGRWSQKETIHLELDLSESGLTYEPGDSLAVVPRNDPALVEAILKATGLAGDKALAARLEGELDITTLSRPVMEAYQKLKPHRDLSALLAADGWRDFIADRQLLDLFMTFDAKLEPGELQGLLRPLAPRSYSIASSPLAHEGEAHLLVSAVRWQSHGLERKGVASTYMAERSKRGGSLPVFLKPNKHFRLPADNDRPLIMVGPGTGVAPFRAFLHQRQALEAKGKNWLFFGDQTFTNDFLYQLEWQQLEKDGILTRIDAAFSRDQPEKIYVQHHMWEARRALWAWLEEGAAFYVCGDATRMAKDVEAMLLRIIAEEGQKSPDQARAYLDDLNRTKRYQRDVY